MEFYISPQSGQFYMINVLENQWLSVTYTPGIANKHRQYDVRPTDVSTDQRRFYLEMAIKQKKLE